jgi:predicted nucleic acid-binding protein
MNGTKRITEVIRMNQTSKSFDINKRNWNNTSTFPDMIYLDTNAVLEIAMQRTHGQLLEDFLIELRKRNGFAIWSDHTLNEVLDVVHYDEYVTYAKQQNLKGNSKKSAWKLAEDSASEQESIKISNNVANKVDVINTYLEQYGFLAETPLSTVEGLSKKIYQNYGGNRKDAKHIAYANVLGVNNILTLDGGILRYPNLNVYGSSQTLVQNYQPGQKPIEFKDLKEIFNQSGIQIGEEEQTG